MEDFKEYIRRVTGEEIDIYPPSDQIISDLPLYIKHTYMFHYVSLQNHQILLLSVRDEEVFNVKQFKSQIDIINDVFGDRIVVLLIKKLSSARRKKLIEKKINFVVPGKQLFIPQIMIELRESFHSSNINKENLIPSAQLILLAHLLNRNAEIEQKNFKQLSEKFQYSTMAISKAVSNLKELGICDIQGGREKHLRFDRNLSELWEKAYPFLISPIHKKVYVDNKPESNYFLFSNETALAEYSNMAASRQIYLAVDRNTYYGLLKQNEFANLNDYEGNFCIEVWKYNPILLATNNCIDPLSLYLCLKDVSDERIEAELNGIIKQYIW